MFLKLTRILGIKLPLVDPSIYISRFAAAMDFGEYTQRVAHDAVRLVQRMDRDWIQTGRRPAGVCGACLLIAARINGFRRTTHEMIYIVKVAEVTIQNRLREFKETESAQLSVRDFRSVWLETEADPPAYARARQAREMEALKKEGADTQQTLIGETISQQLGGDTFVEDGAQHATVSQDILDDEKAALEYEFEEWMQDSSLSQAQAALGMPHYSWVLEYSIYSCHV